MKDDTIDKILIAAAVLCGFFFGTIHQSNKPREVEITRSLIRLADDACLAHDGAKTFTKDMVFVCKDGTQVILK